MRLATEFQGWVRPIGSYFQSPLSQARKLGGLWRRRNLAEVAPMADSLSEATDPRWTSRTSCSVKISRRRAQYRPSAQDADGITAKVKDPAAKFRASPSPQTGSCFVNLTNHPSAQWEPEQTEAALALAEQIEDVPFPIVPPEASERTSPRCQRRVWLNCRQPRRMLLFKASSLWRSRSFAGFRNGTPPVLPRPQSAWSRTPAMAARPAHSASCGFADIRLLDAGSDDG